MRLATLLAPAVLLALVGCAALLPAVPRGDGAGDAGVAPDGGSPSLAEPADAGVQPAQVGMDAGEPRVSQAEPPAEPPLLAAEEEPPPPAPPEVPGYDADAQAHVLDVARSLLTYRYVRAGRGGAFRMDCSGYVRAVHLSLGLDLFVPKPEDPSSRAVHVGGVGLILWYNQVHGTYWPRTGRAEDYAVEPRPGDIVYFHDTHDRNKNRRFDDPYTHVGLVEQVDADGTVTFLHAAGHIVKREKMNLRQPHKGRDEAGNIINHTLRVRKRWEKPGDPHLAAELFAGYGRLQRPGHLRPWSLENAVSVVPSGRQYLRGVRKPGRGGRHRERGLAAEIRQQRQRGGLPKSKQKTAPKKGKTTARAHAR